MRTPPCRAIVRRNADGRAMLECGHLVLLDRQDRDAEQTLCVECDHKRIGYVLLWPGRHPVPPICLGCGHTFMWRRSGHKGLIVFCGWCDIAIKHATFDAFNDIDFRMDVAHTLAEWLNTNTKLSQRRPDLAEMDVR